VSHHLASAKANDALVGATPPRPALLLRELMHMGQIIQSHGMHFFELAGPDLLLGFDSDPATRNVVGLIQANPELATKAVMLRKFGQEIIRMVGGRKIHPNFCVPGGVNKALTIAEKDAIMATYDENMATIMVGLDIIKDWAEKNQDVIDEFAIWIILLNMLSHGRI
jgi:NAD-reducing hydrogenase large subunit